MQIRSTLFWLSSAALGAMAACGQSSNPPTATNGTAPPASSGGGDDGGVVAPGCGLAATADVVTLPAVQGAPAGALDAISAQLTCGAASFTYGLRDMDGDAQTDIVVQSTCNDTSVGTTAWLVYPSTGAGFATIPTRFALPNVSTQQGCATETLADVDGDLRPDIVVTSLCTDTTVGTSRWLVYANTGKTFASTPSAFALPPGATTGAFASLESDTPVCAAGKNQPAYAALDLDGDAKLDVVETVVCDDATIGTTAWRFFKGTGTGVAQTFARFPLPTTPAPSVGAFAALYKSEGTCASNVVEPRYTLLDLDGDLKPDLVVTQACDDTSVGTSKWRLYANDGTKMAAAPADFALPQFLGSTAGAFARLSGAAACNGSAGNPAFSLVDANGDLKYDLFVTRQCNDAFSGVSHWVYFQSTGAGFAQSGTQFAIPPALGGTLSAPLGLSQAAADCGGTTKVSFEMGYFVKNRLGALVTQACGDSSVGATRWLLYPDSCP